MVETIDCEVFVSNELAKDRHKDPKRLLRYGFRVYSQNDEDGILQEIFKRIGTTSKTFIEFGVQVGLECNTMWLLLQNWRGLWIEGNNRRTKAIGRTHRNLIANGYLSVLNSFVTAENINALIAKSYISKFGRDIDLLSIDIDSNDYWVWRAIDVISPRVVVIEYNASWRPPVALSIVQDTSFRWTGNNHFGASLQALANLADKKGYCLVGCTIAGVNAFFVRKDLVKNKFLKPGDVMEHYEPPRFFLAGKLTSGHPPGIGEVKLDPH